MVSRLVCAPFWGQPQTKPTVQNGVVVYCGGNFARFFHLLGGFLAGIIFPVLERYSSPLSRSLFIRSRLTLSWNELYAVLLLVSAAMLQPSLTHVVPIHRERRVWSGLDNDRLCCDYGLCKFVFLGGLSIFIFLGIICCWFEFYSCRCIKQVKWGLKFIARFCF